MTHATCCTRPMTRHDETPEHPSIMSMQVPLTLNYDTNVYLAVSLTSNSVYSDSSIMIPDFPSVSQVGNVGALADVKLLSVPKAEWQSIGEDVLKKLRGDKSNVIDVEVQEPKLRTKRGGHDEL